MLNDAEMNGAILHLKQTAAEIYKKGGLALLPADEQHKELANLLRENFFAKVVIDAPSFVEAVVGERISVLVSQVIAKAKLMATAFRIMMPVDFKVGETRDWRADRQLRRLTWRDNDTLVIAGADGEFREAVKIISREITDDNVTFTCVAADAMPDQAAA
jgi:hypothetical protein